MEPGLRTRLALEVLNRQITWLVPRLGLVPLGLEVSKYTCSVRFSSFQTVRELGLVIGAIP